MLLYIQAIGDGTGWKQLVIMIVSYNKFQIRIPFAILSSDRGCLFFRMLIPPHRASYRASMRIILFLLSWLRLSYSLSVYVRYVPCLISTSSMFTCDKARRPTVTVDVVLPIINNQLYNTGVNLKIPVYSNTVV